MKIWHFNFIPRGKLWMLAPWQVSQYKRTITWGSYTFSPSLSLQLSKKELNFKILEKLACGFIYSFSSSTVKALKKPLCSLINFASWNCNHNSILLAQWTSIFEHLCTSFCSEPWEAGVQWSWKRNSLGTRWLDWGSAMFRADLGMWLIFSTLDFLIGDVRTMWAAARVISRIREKFVCVQNV